MTTWLRDDNDNKCSVEYFGSEEAAKIALDSLKNCRDCTNGSYCSDCSDCADCVRCADCSRSVGCSWLDNKRDLQAVPPTDGSKPGVPPIPVLENIHQQIFSAVTAPGHKLKMDDWHTCDTAHCRGGWAVHLAGEPGYALECFHGTLLAAQLIYRESGAPINPCRFFDSDKDAMADMKRLAEG